MKNTLLASLALTAAAIFTSNQARAWSSCDRWGNYNYGTYTVYNNGWGSCFNAQCITASSGTSWYVDSTQPNTCGVASYANSSRTINKKISAYNGSGSWNYSIASGTRWNASFDIWVPSEFMIWVGRSSTGIYPRGTKKYSAVSIGGHTWDVWREDSSHNVVSLIRTSNSYSGSVNLRTLLDYARVTRGWIGDGTIGKNQFGFENFGTSNVQKRFTLNSCSIGG